MNRRQLLKGAIATAAVIGLPKPAKADLYLYAPFGVPIMMPPPSPPGDLIWNPNWTLYDASFQPPIPWIPNPPSNEFITGLVTYLNSHPGWQGGDPHMEDLLRLYYNYMLAQQSPPDPTILPLAEAYWFGGDFGRAFRNNLNAQGTTEAESLAVLVALAAAIGVAGAAAGMIQGMDLNYVAAGLGNGSIVMRVAMGVGLVSVAFTGAAMLAFSIFALYIVVTKVIPQVPKTSGWPIPEGYRMELPVSAVSVQPL